MKKFSILAITTILSLSAVTANAALIPRETAASVRLPLANVSLSAARPSCRHAMNATEEQIKTTENIIGDILDEVYNGAGYGMTSARANTRIRNAVIAGQTKGYSYEILSVIS